MTLSQQLTLNEFLQGENIAQIHFHQYMAFFKDQCGYHLFFIIDILNGLNW